MLKGKIALITGANRGIGKAIARTFAKNGSHLILVARDIESLQKVKESISEVEVDIFSCDISKESEVKTLFQKIAKISKRIDILVNNAGVLESSLLGMIKRESMDSLFQTNVYGQIYILQYASRMMKRNRAGSVINMSSIMGIQGGRNSSLYSATKAAIVGLSRSLAKELAPEIRVNVIAPGVVKTELISDLSQKCLREFEDATLLKRIATPEEIADVALFLASDMSKFITAEVLNVDGGLCLS